MSLKRTDPVLLERLIDSRCQALTTGCYQKQFLVLKYSRPKSTHHGGFRPRVIEPLTSSPTQAAPTSSQQEKNSTANITTAPSRAPPTEDYHINLKLIGILIFVSFFILIIKILNIKQCSPTKQSDIPVLIRFNNGNLVVLLLKNSIVESWLQLD